MKVAPAELEALAATALRAAGEAGERAMREGVELEEALYRALQTLAA